MISVEQALKLVEENIQTGPATTLTVIDALGHVLANDIVSPLDMPPFRQSAMDGYAINYSDQLTEYAIVGEIAAGSNKIFSLQKGEAVRIFTGAAVPDSANTVVRQEDVIKNNTTISFSAEIKQDSNIRPLGEQIKKDDLALQNGTLIDPATIGFLLTLGLTEVEVYCKPSVAILTTGDELVQPGNSLKHGQVFESNSMMLDACFRNQGILAITHQKIPDKYDQTVNAIKAALENHDFIILSGGISVGDYDFVGKALQELDVNEIFYKVKQKPGKPLFFGKKGNKIIFALPGNPAAALTSFYVYILPALQKFQGSEFKGCRRILLPIANDYIRKAQRSEFLKGQIINNELHVLDAQSSAMLSSFSRADCLIYVSEEVISYKKHELVECLLL